MMVTRWGFSDQLGTVAYGENQEEVFLGHSVSRQQNVSEETAQKIDAEIRRFVEEGYAEARRILTEKMKDLEALAQGLLEYETLSGQEIRDLLDGKPPIRDADLDKPTSRGSSIPKTGKPKPKKGGEPDAGGMEPQPS